jgi:hypothetical protein
VATAFFTGIFSPSLNTAACGVSAGFGSQAFSPDWTGHLRSRESDDGRLAGRVQV